MITDKKRKILVTVLLTFISFAVVHLFSRLMPIVFETVNARAVDKLFLFRSESERFRPLYNDIIVHIDLNNSSLQKLDNLYLNRSHHARVIRNLTGMQVAVQLYDFIFAARSNDVHDMDLIDAVSEAGNVYFGLAFELGGKNHTNIKKSQITEELNYLDTTSWKVETRGDAPGFYVGINPLTTFPALARASRGLGYLSVKCDWDGVFRRVPLLVRYKGAYYPSFPFRVICDYLRVPPEKIIVESGKAITLENAKHPGESKGHDIVIPIDYNGNMRINLIGKWERMKHYGFADVLNASEDRDEMQMWKEELAGKIVVVSEISTGATDVGPVPTDNNYPLSGLHANVIHTILTESFLSELSGLEMVVIEALLLIVVLVLSLRFSALYFTIGVFATFAFYLGIVATGFLYANIVLMVVQPLLMTFLALFLILIYRYIREEKEKLESIRQRDFIRATFGRYLSNEVVEELLGSPRGLQMSGELREVTFLVSDLRDFSALASRLSPQKVIKMVNHYLENMVEIIGFYRGTVNEFEGDAILAFFGAPLTGYDDQERAVACAVEMQNRMTDVNTGLRRLNLPELAMGIGINSGEVVVGNIGSEKRAKYGAIGSPINIAYRIESYTVGGQILISPNIYEKVRSTVRVRGTMDVQLKGVDRSLTVYDVIGIEGAV